MVMVWNDTHRLSTDWNSFIAVKTMLSNPNSVLNLFNSCVYVFKIFFLNLSFVQVNYKKRSTCQETSTNPTSQVGVKSKLTSITSD